MQPSAAKADTARLGASLMLLGALLATPAAAGDRALIDFIGYSPDGRYFAFEEYGIQDGSGFPYSSIFIVDLPADKWTYGSPFRAGGGEVDGERPLAEVRAEARGKAGERLEELEIAEPADILALLGDGVPDADGKSLTFANPGWGPPGSTGDERHRLTLETFPTQSAEDCLGLTGEEPLGYALGLDGDELHRDGETIPRSRGCVLDYRLYAVVRPFERNDGRVAIVSVYPFGFEGPDRRFIAVPLDR